MRSPHRSLRRAGRIPTTVGAAYAFAAAKGARGNQRSGGVDMDGASVLLIRGLFGVGAGLLALLWPGLTVAFLAVLFGAYAFLDGVTNLALGMRRTAGQKRRW